MATAEAWLDGPREVAIVGDPADPATHGLRTAAWAAAAPGAVVVVGAVGSAHPLLEGRVEVEGRPAAYVCRHFVCDRPVSEPTDLALALDPRRDGRTP